MPTDPPGMTDAAEAARIAAAYAAAIAALESAAADAEAARAAEVEAIAAHGAADRAEAEAIAARRAAPDGALPLADYDQNRHAAAMRRHAATTASRRAALVFRLRQMDAWKARSALLARAQIAEATIPAPHPLEPRPADLGIAARRALETEVGRFERTHGPLSNSAHAPHLPAA